MRTTVATCCVFLLLWQAAVSTGLAPAAFLPAPLAVLSAAGHLLASGIYFDDLAASMSRVLVAFGLSLALALPLAYMAGTSYRMGGVILPLIGFFRYTPVAAFVPLCILWIGIGEPEKVAIIFIGTFFQLVVMLTDAVRAVPEEYYRVARTLGGTRFQVLRDVTVPASASAIYDSLRLGLGWAWSYVVLAELVAATTGVGYRLVEAQRFMRTADVFAGILLVGLVGLLLDVVLEYIKPVFFPWQTRR